MAQIPSRKRHVVEALVYAALITLMISRAFLGELKRTTKALRGRIPEERWAVLWNTMATDLLAIVLGPPQRYSEKYLSAMIYREMVDPNRSRELLLERAFA
jgi:hypothetical protein